MKRLAVLLLLLVAGPANPAPAAAPDIALCEDLAGRMRTAFAVRPGVLPTLDTLAPFARPAPVVAGVDTEADLSRKLHLSGALLKELTDLNWTYEQPDVLALQGTSLVVFKKTGGTMHCEDLIFIDRRDPAKPVIAPAPQTSGSPCYLTSHWIGQLGGKPVVALESRDIRTPGYEVSLSAWTGAAWGPACHVTAVYEPAFPISERFYPGAQWEALEIMAPLMAAAAWRAPEHELAGFGPPPPAADQARVAEMRALSAGEPETLSNLPTFGRRANGWDYLPPPVPQFPLVLVGKTYWARFGHPTIGWRETGDFDLGVWDVKDGKLVPVAGLILKTAAGRIGSLKVGAGMAPDWVPWGD